MILQMKPSRSVHGVKCQVPSTTLVVTQESSVSSLGFGPLWGQLVYSIGEPSTQAIESAKSRFLTLMTRHCVYLMVQKSDWLLLSTLKCIPNHKVWGRSLDDQSCSMMKRFSVSSSMVRISEVLTSGWQKQKHDTLTIISVAKECEYDENIYLLSY